MPPDVTVSFSLPSNSPGAETGATCTKAVVYACDVELCADAACGTAAIASSVAAAATAVTRFIIFIIIVSYPVNLGCFVDSDEKLLRMGRRDVRARPRRARRRAWSSAIFSRRRDYRSRLRPREGERRDRRPRS